MAYDDEENLRDWEVKPIFRVTYPSTLIGVGDGANEFTVWGVNRASGEINRNWEVIHSVERHNQGYKKMPSDLTITIAVKEQSHSFEMLRRLGKSGTMFDLEYDLLKNVDDNVSESNDYSKYSWMQGFEEWKGCIITRESQTIEIGDIPIREFECIALDHTLQSPDGDQDPDGLYGTVAKSEGSGVPPDMDDLMA